MQTKKDLRTVLKVATAATLIWLSGGSELTGQPYIYWTDVGANAIGRANADGSSPNASLLTGFNASGIAANDTHVFWTNLNGYIVRANLDGSNPDTLLSGLPAPGGIAVNSTHIFWVTQNSSPVNIGRANLDGSSPNGTLLAVPNLPTTVFGLAANDTHLYWGDCGPAGDRGTIGRSLVDGTGADHTFITGGACPVGLFITPTKLYWANAASTTIGIANPDGTSANQSFVTGADRPGGAVLTSSHLFWTNQNSASIGRANADGSSPNQSFITGLSFPIWITGQPLAAALPVELVSFEILSVDRGYELEWVTASETNNAGFEIEQSCGGCGEEAWKSIGFVQGHGTTSEPTSYSYPLDLEPGSHVFRLRQIDFDGAVEYSPTVEVFVELPGSHLLTDAYPNPFSRETSLSLTVTVEQEVRVDLFDSAGRRVDTILSARVQSHSPIRLKVDGGGRSPGLYLVRVNGERFTSARPVILLD